MSAIGPKQSSIRLDENLQRTEGGARLSVADEAANRAQCGGGYLLAIIRSAGFAEGNSSEPGQYVIEKAFVEK